MHLHCEVHHYGDKWYTEMLVFPPAFPFACIGAMRTPCKSVCGTNLVLDLHSTLYTHWCTIALWDTQGTFPTVVTQFCYPEVVCPRRINPRRVNACAVVRPAKGRRKLENGEYVHFTEWIFLNGTSHRQQISHQKIWAHWRRAAHP